MTTQENVKLDDVHQQCSLSNDFIIKSCLNRKCLDNITLVMVSFENFERIFNYPVLHTYEDQPVSRKLLENADTINTNRLIKNNTSTIESGSNIANSNSLKPRTQNLIFDKINKIRSESSKNNTNINNIPASSKGIRPKLLRDNILDDRNNNNDNLIEEQNRNNKNGPSLVKLMTPLNSSKER